MPKASPIQTSFNTGELSPLMFGRTDFEKYKSGMALCQNWVPTIQGPLINRPGTKFTTPVKDQSKFTQLIPFEFNVEQAYILEFGENYIRFFKDNGFILEAEKVITGATQTNPVVISSAVHGYGNGDEIFIESVVGMTELNNKKFIAANVSAGTFELAGFGIQGTQKGLLPRQQRKPTISGPIFHE